MIRIALAVGIAAFVLSLTGLIVRGFGASDFSWQLRAAERVVDGESPYTDPRNGDATRGGPYYPYPFDSPVYYPIHAALVAVPFSGIPSDQLAAASFFGVASGLLAYGMARKRHWHGFAVFLSPSFMLAAGVAQWSPLLMATAFLPGLFFLAPIKPNLGLIAAIYGRPKPLYILTCIAVAFWTFILFPWWPADWLNSISQSGRYIAPVKVMPIGPLLLLAALRWRSREGQTLLGLSLVPQLTWFYDQLLLWLIPRNKTEAAVLTAFSWIAWLGFKNFRLVDIFGAHNVGDARPWIMACMFLPALVIVLQPWQWRLPRRQRLPVSVTAEA